ncbi:hypothetical protein, partial [Demequina sp.]|uniref:hypothetical protein n=1 Tax=Demequina sp. TaxID=2050685 RepID=UPI0025F20F34
EMRSLLRHDGMDGRGHRSEAVTHDEVRKVNLVIAFSANQVDYLLRMAPEAKDRIFLLLELVAFAQMRVPLVGAGAEARLMSVARAGAAHRHLLAGIEVPDVPDPFGGSRAEYEAAYGAMRSAVDVIDRWVRGL